MNDAAKQILDAAEEQGIDRSRIKEDVSLAIAYNDTPENHAETLAQYAEEMAEVCGMTEEQAFRGLVSIIKAEDHGHHRDPQTTWDRADAALDAFLS